jgi:hypothetical protein
MLALYCRVGCKTGEIVCPPLALVASSPSTKSFAECGASHLHFLIGLFHRTLLLETVHYWQSCASKSWIQEHICGPQTTTPLKPSTTWRQSQPASRWRVGTHANRCRSPENGMVRWITKRAYLLIGGAGARRENASGAGHPKWSIVKTRVKASPHIASVEVLATRLSRLPSPVDFHPTHRVSTTSGLPSKVSR